MIAAVIALSLALAGALGAIVYLVRRQQTSLDAEVAAGKKDVADELAIQEANRERDEALTASAAAIVERDEARAALTSAQAALSKAKKELNEHVVKEIRNAPSGTVALAVLDELWSHVPNLPANGAGTSDRDGGGDAPAVQPAAVAE